MSNIIIEKSDIKSRVEKLELYSDEYPFSLSFRVKNFEDEKDFIKFLKSCEKIVRGSFEYKQWREYLITVLQINKCIITHEDIGEVPLEIHHHPVSLFTIIKSIILKNIDEKKEFSTFDVSLSCMELHFQNIIGYTPLIESMHSKFHLGFLQIPIELVRGNYRKYLLEYSKYLDETDVEAINVRMNVKLKDLKEQWSVNNYPGIVNG